MLDAQHRLGLRIVVVAFAPRESLVGYQQRQRLEHLLVLSDPERDSYRAFGFGRGSIARVWLHPRVWIRYVRLILAGGRPGAAHEDTLQLGGDALIDARGRIAWTYRSAGPEDRPTVDQIAVARADLL